MTTLPVFVYSIPAIIALLVKCGTLYFSHTARIRNAQTHLFFAALMASIVLSLAEVAMLNRLFSDPPWPQMVAYFATTIPAIALLLHLSISTSFPDWNGRRFMPVYVALYGIAMLLEVLLLFTPLLVAGMAPFRDYSFTRVPGPLYWLYEVFVVASFLGILLVPLCFGLRSDRPHWIRTKCKLWVAAVMPLALLVISIVALLHFKMQWINSTVTVPLALAFFYGVIAYAVHNYRLFDVEFFVPWTKLRKRKTAFYDRIRTMIAEIADLDSVGLAIDRLADTLRCPVALVGGPQPVLALASSSKRMIEFPLQELRGLGGIVVANEIGESMPRTKALMQQHGVAAIVPFYPHSKSAASWMLLGESFSEQVYTPLDFKMVEQLFDRLGELFLDKLLFLRAQLHDVREQMQTLQFRLDMAQEESQRLREQNTLLRRRVTALEQKPPTPRQQAAAVVTLVPDGGADDKPLEQYVHDLEARLIARALQRCDGNKAKAARLLGLKPNTLHYKIERYGLTATGTDADTSD